MSAASKLTYLSETKPFVTVAHREPPETTKVGSTLGLGAKLRHLFVTLKQLDQETLYVEKSARCYRRGRAVHRSGK